MLLCCFLAHFDSPFNTTFNVWKTAAWTFLKTSLFVKKASHTGSEHEGWSISFFPIFIYIFAVNQSSKFCKWEKLFCILYCALFQKERQTWNLASVSPSPICFKRSPLAWPMLPAAVNTVCLGCGVILAHKKWPSYCHRNISNLKRTANHILSIRSAPHYNYPV